jgi:TIR domain
VADFHWYLREFLTLELRLDETVDNDDASRLDIRSGEAFPQGGPLNEALEDYVLKSEFLFIFLGRGYLRSQYCLAELEAFRRKASGSVDEALRRTYVVVVDQDAVRRLHGPPPESLPSERVALWKRLQDFANRGIRKEDLLDGDMPLPVMAGRRRERRAAEPFHSRCLPLIREFKAKLVERRPALRAPLGADIFVSYAREDEGRVRPLVRLLEQEGLQVFWDCRTRPGRDWHAAISLALKAARCAIVVWSRNSIESDWVWGEAADAKKRGIYLPVLIDDEQPPVGFRRIQWVDFSRSDFDSDAGLRAALLDAIREMVDVRLGP